MDDYLAKPISREQLYEVLRRTAGYEPVLAAEEPAAGPAARGSSVLAIGELMDRVGGDEALARELLAIFAAGSPARVETARTAAAQGNWQAVAEVAHELKGAAANLGAKEVSAAATRLERSARAGDAGPAREAARALEEGLKTLTEFLQAKGWTR